MMFVVIFVVQPGPGQKERYLEWARYLRPTLETVDGFIANERFASSRRDNRILALSTWRDEQSLIRWRTVGEHQMAQKQGRAKIFDDYLLRVGEVVADTQPPPGVPAKATRFAAMWPGVSPWSTISEITTPDQAAPGDLARHLGLADSTPGLAASEVFDSIYTPGKRLLLVDWRDADAAAWQPAGDAANLRHRRVRVVREYGMYDRAQAPQFYPAVEPKSTRR